MADNSKENLETAAYSLFAYFNYYAYNEKSKVAVKLPKDQALRDILWYIQPPIRTVDVVDVFDPVPFPEGQGVLVSLDLDYDENLEIDESDEKFEKYIDTVSKYILEAFPSLKYLNKKFEEYIWSISHHSIR